jgi:hypothetical protein
MKQTNSTKNAVEILKIYIDTYDSQKGYEDYSTQIYIDDILYGLAISLSNEYTYAPGFEQFKKDLQEYLNDKS